MPDIDIDFLNRDQALKLFDHTPASMIDNNQMIKHRTGVYLHEVPVDAVTGLCQIPYDKAEEEGFFKIDFLNVSIYQDIQDEQHLIKLMNTEPLWSLLEQKEFVDLLFHVSGHSSVLKTMKPKSIEQLAAVLAMIRPAKRYLIGKDWPTVLAEVWSKNDTDVGYAFRKSHSFSYAMVVIVHMNLICEKLDEEAQQLKLSIQN